MSAAVAAILEGMPEPRDLRMREHDGRCVITAGTVVLFDYAAGDVVMRNVALAVLRQLGFRGRAVAAVLGLSEAYVATLHSAARRDGSAALAMQDRRGAPGKVTAAQWEQARAWRGQDASDAEIGRRLGVANTTVSRGLGPRGQAPAGDDPAGRAPAESLFTGAGTAPEPEPGPGPGPEPGPEPEPGAGLPPGGGPRPAAAGGGGALVAVRGGDAAARVPRAGRRRDGPGSGRRRAAGRGAPDGRQHVLRAGSGDNRAVQAPGRRRGRAAGRAGRAARPAGAAPGTGKDRGPHRPAEAAADVRVRDARRRPGGLRRVLRR